MKYLFILLVALQIANSSELIQKTATKLTGKIIDKESGEPIPGARIYFQELKSSAISTKGGNYKIENLPKKKLKVQIIYFGYKSIIEIIDLSQVKEKNFAMEISVKEIKDVVVTGISEATELNHSPIPIDIIPSIKLEQMAANNIIDAIASSPGVSQITTGSGISKPVIRGLGYNRVVVVNDGIRQEGQQWGDEHGIEIDEFSVNKVEILKGAASLAYGSDAMAGVINMISAPTLAEGTSKVNLISNYQTNNGLIALSGNYEGNKDGLIWDLRYSTKSAHSYQNKYDGYVFNSGFGENTIIGIVGLNKSWGYSHLHLSSYNFTPGIIEGERDFASGKFVKLYKYNDSIIGKKIASNDELVSYSQSNPYQKIKHMKAVLENNIFFGDGTITAIIGYQQNQRQEYSDILNPNQYGLSLLLNTINYDFKYNLPMENEWNWSIGINGMQQNSQNKGVEFLVPDYNLFDIGIYSVIKKTFQDLDLIAGVRYDSRSENAKDLYLDTQGKVVNSGGIGVDHKFTSFDNIFTGISASIGASYQISEDIYTKLNISRGFRAPNIAELAANGVHDGTTRYEIGNSGLRAENSLQIDYAIGLNTEHVSGEINLFSNNINNFIFSRKLISQNGTDSLNGGYQSFKFVSGDASLIGGEVTLDIHPHPLDWLHFENSLAYVKSVQLNQPDSTKYLPFTPPAKFQSELRANIKSIADYLKSTFIKIEIEHYFAQNNFYSAFGTETSTSGYTLINCGFGTDWVSAGKTLLSIYFNAMNITDIAYQSHLSRLKYLEANNAIGRIGVYNMGRNFSLKLIVPVDL